MSRNSVKSASNDFSKVVHADIPRSTFKRPSTLVTTFDAGYLVPVYIDEILPGDTYKMSLQHVARLITPLVPVMDNIDLEFFAFFVPNRIVWDSWQKLQGENQTSAWTPSSPPNGVPKWGSTFVTQELKIGDYYGLPVGMDLDYHDVNLLPFRGYYKIWNDWFRNQNLQAPLAVYTGDLGYTHGTTININSALLKVNKPFDYFTSCLPAPQKGDSQVIPVELNELIPIITTADDAMSGAQYSLKLKRNTDGSATVSKLLAADASSKMAESDSAVGTVANPLYPANLWADPTAIGSISSTTISDLRTAFQIQKLYERDARGGTRYVEMLKSHFGVDAGDYRLQRPEFLGHCKSMVAINQVEQTSETNTTPQGNVSAYGHSQGNDFLFNKSFVEHGFLHIFAVARHKKTYQQGLDRFWSRQDRLDYYLPVLAHISEQPVYTKEIYALDNNPDVVFGYQEAWSDYRYKPNRVTAQMRQDATIHFEMWHFADRYASAPTLVDAWMQDNSNTNLQRLLAVATGHQIKLNARFDLEATRPIPVNSIPGMIDHF